MKQRLALLSVLLVALASPSARAFECACATESSGGSTSFFSGSGILGSLMSGMDSGLNSFVSSFIGSMYSSIIGQAQPEAESKAINTVSAVNTQLSDQQTSESYRQKSARASARDVDIEYTPPKSACIQTVRQHELETVERTQAALIRQSIQEKTDSFTNQPGTPAENGAIARDSALFTKAVGGGYCGVAVPAGITCDATRGANNNVSLAVVAFNRDQIKTPEEIDATKDATNLIFRNAMRNRADGVQLAQPAARASMVQARADTQGYLLAMNAFSESIESLRDPTDVGATMSADSFFTKPVSYKTLAEHYQGGHDMVDAQLAAQDSTKANWHALALQLDDNSRLLFKIFKRAEQWDLMRSFMLKQHLEETQVGNGPLLGVQR